MTTKTPRVSQIRPFSFIIVLPCSWAYSSLAHRASKIQIAFWTLPAFKHRVQTVILMVRPLTTARTLCRLGLNARLLRFPAKLTWLPNFVVLPQIAHEAIVFVTSKE